jgi:Flp pilus assembly protein TadB
MVEHADPADHDEACSPGALRRAGRLGPRLDLLVLLLGALLLAWLLLAVGCGLTVLAVRIWTGAT